MNFKYYDLLSNLIVGAVAFYAIWKLLFPSLEFSEWVVIPAGYVFGYFLDAFSSVIEPLLHKAIGGKPFEKLLSAPRDGRNWTGTKKVKFFFSEKVIRLLREDTGDPAATPEKMFRYAKLKANSNMECRVSDFNGHYALARVMLTTLIVAAVIAEVKYYDVWYSWPISLGILLLAWNRYKERGYYYTREVLNEYLRARGE